MDDDELETEPTTDEEDAAADETAVAVAPVLSLIGPRPYGHIARALYERPWALQPSMLRTMSTVLRARMEIGKRSEDLIAIDLEAAKAANGPRDGGGSAGNVHVIPMYGVISQRQSVMGDTSGGCSVDSLRSELYAALDDSGIDAIVFDIDSPGGSVDAIPEFAAELRSLRAGSKPIVGQINTLCASAALWAAANMTELVITPSGEVGSIGVYAMHEDWSKADEMAGVKVTLVSAGKYKTEGNQYEPLTSDAAEAIQGQVDAFYSMFVNDVAKGRKVQAADVEAKFGQGRTMLAKQALSAGLVDKIDTLDATVARLKQAALTPDKRQADSSRKPALSAAGMAATTTPDPAWVARMGGRIR
jgi:signal peptide peptidase SppA